MFVFGVVGVVVPVDVNLLASLVSLSRARVMRLCQDNEEGS